MELTNLDPSSSPPLPGAQHWKSQSPEGAEHGTGESGLREQDLGESSTLIGLDPPMKRTREPDSDTIVALIRGVSGAFAGDQRPASLSEESRNKDMVAVSK